MLFLSLPSSFPFLCAFLLPPVPTSLTPPSLLWSYRVDQEVDKKVNTPERVEKVD